MIILSLAVKNLIRSRRSSISLAIGMLISLTLFNALNFNILVARDRVFYNTISSGLQITAYPKDSQTNVNEFLAQNQSWLDMTEDPQIVSIDFYARFDGYNNSDYNTLHAIVIGLSNSTWGQLISENNLTFIGGSLSFSQYSSETRTLSVVAVTRNWGASLGTVNVSLYEYPEPSSILLDVIGFVSLNPQGTFLAQTFKEIQFSVLQYRQVVFLTTIENLAGIPSSRGNLVLGLDPGMISPDDISGSSAAVTRKVKSLSINYPSLDFSRQLEIELFAAELQMIFFQTVVIIFLVPIFFLALYLSNLASKLNIETRRRQYGLFLSRGITPKTILWSFHLEGVLIGITCGVMAFILAPVIGGVIGTMLPLSDGPLQIERLLPEYYIQQWSQLVWSVLIGGVAGYFVTRLPKFYLYLPPQRLLDQYRYEEAETSDEYRGKKDVLALALGITPVAVALFAFLVFVLGLPAIFLIPLALVGSYALYIAPFSPFLVSYGLSSYLTRQKRILRFVSSTFSRFTPNLQGLTNKSILGRSFQVSRIAFIISLALTFIIFPLILSASLQDYGSAQDEFMRGADVRIDAPSVSTLNTSLLDGFSEVASSTKIIIGTERIGYDYITIVGLDGDQFAEIANIKSYWGKEFKETVQGLDNNAVMINSHFQATYELDIGETLKLRSGSYTVIGVYSSVGGTDLLGTNTFSAIVSSSGNITAESTSFLVRLHIPDSREDIVSLYEKVTILDPSVRFRSKFKLDVPLLPEFDQIAFLIGILDLQAFLLTVVSLGALSFLMIIRLRERSREIGTWRSRGMSNRQIVSMNL
ncbi:MAG TPA: ABC transporter permease, partial [Candidatus Hodarchaeales archaeon]|nr:ABC transporter permease [Candidatus Hodarchaeales archaeon]